MPVIKSQFTLRLLVSDHAKIKKIAEVESKSADKRVQRLLHKKALKPSRIFRNYQKILTVHFRMLTVFV